MKESFIEKCKIIFNMDNIIEKSEEKIRLIEQEIDIKFSEEHKYLMLNYGNCFLNEKYAVCSKYHSPIVDPEYGTEPFLFFLSTGGKDNYMSSVIR